MHDKSYIKFKHKRCILIIGKNGNNADAAKTENIFPKLEDAVILMYLIIFAYVFLPSTIPSSNTIKSFSNNTMSADSFATSTAVSTEIPISAHFIADASLIPSPINPTVCPFSRRIVTILDFWSGVNLANTSVVSATFANSSSDI